MFVLIDDERILGADIICRTPLAAGIILPALQYFDYTLGIDHDLGRAKTGHDIIKWAIAREVLPNTIQLVTMNPVGREAMSLTLQDAGYTTNDGLNFVKECD
jgi:hypothetical protein